MSTLYPSFPYQSEINNNHKEIWWRWDQNTHFQSPVFSIITLGNNLYNFNFLCFTLLYYLFIYLLQSFTWHNQNCHLQLIPLLYPQAKEKKEKKEWKKTDKRLLWKASPHLPLSLPASLCVQKSKDQFQLSQIYADGFKIYINSCFQHYNLQILGKTWISIPGDGHTCAGGEQWPDWRKGMIICLLPPLPPTYWTLWTFKQAKNL